MPRARSQRTTTLRVVARARNSGGVSGENVNTRAGSQELGVKESADFQMTTQIVNAGHR